MAGRLPRKHSDLCSKRRSENADKRAEAASLWEKAGETGQDWDSLLAVESV